MKPAPTPNPYTLMVSKISGTQENLQKKSKQLALKYNPLWIGDRELCDTSAALTSFLSQKLTPRGPPSCLTFAGRWR